MKKWTAGKPDTKISSKLSASAGISRLCAEVLTARGYETAAGAASFILPEELSSPFLLMDMQKAADTINSALENNERICIYGDYDCDGITATAMLYLYLQCMGADVRYYVPERSEGYGMNQASIRTLADDGVTLIITVDNGISAIAEAELIYELGMRLVVTDHHQPPLGGLPRAEAIVNPHREGCPSLFKALCGAGVVLKLIAALDGSEDMGAVMEQFGDIAALGTVADVVPLKGENRYIVSEGLRMLENTENPGLCALIEEAGLADKPITSYTLGFVLAPRINAAGRFGSPLTALRLLITDEEEEAVSLAAELTALNAQRRECENRILTELDAQIKANPLIICEPVLVFAGEGWHHGVIGIICSRISERYGKPCYIMTIEGDTARGSARAPEGYSVFKSLNYCAPLFTHFGGHDGAGGYTVRTEDIPALGEMLREYARRTHGTDMPKPVLAAEKILTGEDVAPEEVEGLSILQPFGEGNPEPLFCISGARVEELQPLSGGKHTKMKLSFDGVVIFALLFGVSPERTGLNRGDEADFMVTLEINDWRGRRLVSVKIKDYRLSGVEQQKYFAAHSAYESFVLDRELPPAYYARILPQRTDLETVYRSTGNQIPDDIVYIRAAKKLPSLNYCKFRLCLDIFAETGLLEIDPCTLSSSRISVGKKVDIEASALLKHIRKKALNPKGNE